MTSWRDPPRHEAHFGVAEFHSQPPRLSPSINPIERNCLINFSLTAVLRRVTIRRCTWHAHCYPQQQASGVFVVVHGSREKLPFFPRCEGLFPPTTRRAFQQPHS